MDKLYDTWIYDSDVVDWHMMDDTNTTFDWMGTFDWPKSVDALYDIPLPSWFKRSNASAPYVRNNSINT